MARTEGKLEVVKPSPDVAWQGAREGALAKELGKLNRHWYRRCLDTLGSSLKEAGSNPTVEELRKLCDSTITSFLEAVVSQAPDSDAPQFPADRAYFIPFEADLSGRFNFAKPYYQLLQAPKGLAEKLNGVQDSLWSFLPWFEGGVRIDRATSVDQEGRTGNFRELVAPRESIESRWGGAAAGETKSRPERRDRELVLRKALLLRGERDEHLAALRLSKSLRSGAFRGHLRQALAFVFDIYKEVPGNPDIELILVNQAYILRWLAALSGLTAEISRSQKASSSALSMQKEEFKGLLRPLLHGYFLLHPLKPTADQEELLDLLQRWIVEEKREGSEQFRESWLALNSAIADALHNRRKELSKAKFFEDLLSDLTVEAQRSVGTRESDSEQKKNEKKNTPGNSIDNLAREQIEERLKQLRPHFTSFHRYFLRPDQEGVLEQDLEALSEDDPRRAGRTDSSFVWVCPDFEELSSSLPERRPLRASDETIRKLENLLSKINKPYLQFSHLLEVESLRPYYSMISNYWRTRGQASRSDRMFASFQDTGPGLTLPPEELFGSGWNDYRKEPFPQNVFLRVRICDSLNEPVIDGLFVFSTDYDEVTVWGKSTSLRREDTEDLLSFTKVFFFIVRDFIHGLDRAREAADIGRLNQYLFDRRLKQLEGTLERRLRDYDEKGLDLTEGANWDQVIYEAVNSYAHALLDKPGDIRNETFPFDRLLILPIGDVRDKDAAKGDYAFPFFLFQSIFVESRQGKIDGSHYSLIKPFQSPVEKIDVEKRSRFHYRSFQKEFEAEEGRIKLSEYLEKYYIGAGEAESSEDSGEPPSFVVRASENDTGRRWAKDALVAFWEGRRENASVDLWCDFLSRLTEDYVDLVHGKLATSRVRGAQLWFLFRFGFLRALLHGIDAGEESAFETLREAYHDRELRLKFGDRDDLDILWLAGGPEKAAKARKLTSLPPDLLDVLAERWSGLASLGDVNQDIVFSEYFLKNQDPLVLDFFKFLTCRVCNTSEVASLSKKQESKPIASWTWYQPLLTRPLPKEGTMTEAIGDRVPQYQDIEQGRDALAMFLGLVNLQVGRTERETRHLRCVVVMIRDYDDSKVGLYQSEKEIKERLQSDLADLRLFTATFFQNTQRTLNAARERQQVRVLSTDIQQIARNWYSEGVGIVVERLRKQLRGLLRRPKIPQLNRLRVETVQHLFEAMVEVLIRKERNRTVNNQIIPLESFPFDRILHIPLLFGSKDAACLSYVRAVPDLQSSQEGLAGDVYQKIRQRGRHAVLGGGKKRTVGEPVHVSRRDELVRFPLLGGDGKEEEQFSLTDLVELLKDSGRLDLFVRRLYRAGALQTLTLAGVLFHVLELMKDPEQGEGKEEGERGSAASLLPPELRRVEERLEEVLQDSVRSLEQQIGETGGPSLRTEAAMDRAVHLPTLAPLIHKGLSLNHTSPGEDVRELNRLFTDVGNLPVLADLFQALEMGRGDWRYGLEQDGLRRDEGRSKLFHVYYSVPAPEGFLETFTFNPRKPCYRGIFCFVVDDASTDDKSAAEAAEVSDQEDIRTFVHNAMSSLRLVLDQQSLESRLVQPGVEQFVSGMLHRLKNDLNVPVLALAHIEGKLRARGAEQVGQVELLQRIRGAQGSLGGAHEIFQKLKNFGENRIVLLRNFSSEVLGWMFMESLCFAARKEVQRPEEGRDEASGAEALFDALRSLEQYAQRQRGACESSNYSGDSTSASGGGLQRIDRGLHHLEKAFEGFLASAETQRGEGQQPARRIELSFSYDVFHTTQLIFRGSYQLPEALNILIENSFQAAWGYLQDRMASGDGNLVARVALTCRRSPDQAGEILVEIENSSKGLHPKFIGRLNAPNPEPITAQRYRRSGGGKKGGSGFGHYFARRIITEFCGGREARRRLDARIEDVAKGLTRVRINLLEAEPPELCQIDAERLVDSAGKIFEELRGEVATTAAMLPKGSALSLPGSVESLALMQVGRFLLEADRRRKESEMYSLAQFRLCLYLKSATEWLTRAIRRLLETQITEEADALGKGDGSADFQKELEEMRGALRASAIRPGSFHDLKVWLEHWHKRDPELLTRLVLAEESIKGFLARFLACGRLDPIDLLNGDNREMLLGKFALLQPFLRPEAYERGLSVLFDGLRKDEFGHPIANRDHLWSFFRLERWKYRSALEKGRLTLEFELIDAMGKEEDEETPEECLVEVDVLKDFPKELMAYTFAQYQAALAESNGAAGGGNGSVAMVRRMIGEGLNQKAHCVGARFLRLELGLKAAQGRTETAEKG